MQGSAVDYGGGRGLKFGELLKSIGESRRLGEGV